MTARPNTIEIPSRPTTRSSSPAAAVRQFVREQELEFPFAVFGLHWLFVTVVAALATRFAYTLPPVQAVGYELPELSGWRSLIIQPFRNWDGFWYGLIAERGYDVHPATTAFWPLYPWTMRATADFFGIYVETAGVILSNLAFFGALVVLYRVVSREWGEGVARRTLVLLAFFPTAFYFSAVYSESFFLLFSLLTFYWAKDRRWWLAGLAGALAALTRNVGILLLVPLTIMFLKTYGLRLDPRRWPRETLALAIPGFGPLLYFGYLWYQFDDPLLTLDVQKGWARTQAMPWETFQMAFDQLGLAWLRFLLDSPGWASLTSREVRLSFAEFESLDIFAAALAIPLLIYTLRKLPLEYGAYAATLFCLPLFSPSTIHPLMSFPRFSLVLFPLFVALALLTRRPLTFAAILAPFVLLLTILTIQFTTWFWVA